MTIPQTPLPQRICFAAYRMDLWRELHALKLPLESELFCDLVAEWPVWLRDEMRAIIRMRFGDEGISRASILESLQKLRQWPLDPKTRAVLVGLGKSCEVAGVEEALSAALAEVRRHYFFLMAAYPDTEFGCIREMSPEEGASLIRGLAVAEECGYSRALGSVSMVNRAFHVYQIHPVNVWAELADWIIANTTNDYIPFNFRRTRYQWETCRVESPSPSETWDRVNRAENARGVERTERFNREQQEATDRAKAKAKRSAAVHQEHASKRQEHARRREAILQDLAGIPPLSRIKRICEEVDFPLDALPTDYAVLGNEVLMSMSLDLRDAVLNRLKDRRNGPWRDLFLQLQSTPHLDQK